MSSRVVPFIEGVLDQEGVLSDTIGEAGILKGLQIGTAAEAARSRNGNRAIWEIKVMREEALEDGPYTGIGVSGCEEGEDSLVRLLIGDVCCVLCL